MIYKLKDLIEHANCVSIELNGMWVPMRPMAGSLYMRLRAALLVLSGKADAVTWPEGQ